MAKIYDPSLIAKLCETLGIERVSEVTRVVLDIKSGDFPMLYVQRIADPVAIIAGLSAPSIELRRDDPGAAPKVDKVEFCNWCPIPTFPDARFHPDGGAEHREQAKVERIDGAPTFNGPIRGAKIAWGNGDVTQNG